MKKAFLQLLAALVIGLFSVAQLDAQATLSVQGTIQRSTGAAVDDGDYDIIFRLYTAPTGGTAIWSETQSGIEIIGGVYSVALGSVNPLNVPFDQTYYLGISVGTGAEHTPRTQLTSSPYALSLLGQDNKFPSTGLVQMSAVATGQETTTATSYTVAADDHVIYLDHTANQNVTLPAATAANAGRNLMLVNKEAVAKTLTSSNYVSLAGATSTTVPANSAIDLQSNGSVWRQTGGYVTPVAPTKVFVRCSLTNNVSIPTGTNTTLPFVAYTNIGGNHFSNNTFTAPRTGIYHVSGHWFGPTPHGQTLSVLPGGTCSGCPQVFTNGFYNSTYAGAIFDDWSVPVYMNAGETLILYGSSAAGSPTISAGAQTWLVIAEN